MSVLDRLGLSNKKKKTPVFSNYFQKQEYIKAQAKKHKSELETKLAQVKTPVLVRECPICEKPMNVPKGTIQHCHSECKSDYKRAVRRLAKQ